MPLHNLIFSKVLKICVSNCLLTWGITCNDELISCPQHCDILRRAAVAGGLLVDAMISSQDSSINNSSSVPLMVVENGCGSPCIDLRQVSSELAAAAKDADLVFRNFYIAFSLKFFRF